MEILIYTKHYCNIKLHFTNLSSVERLEQDLGNFNFIEYLSKNPITDSQWMNFEQINPCIFKNKYWWAFIIDCLGRQTMMDLLNNMKTVMRIKEFRLLNENSISYQEKDFHINIYITNHIQKVLPFYTMNFVVNRYTQNTVELQLTDYEKNILEIESVLNGTLKEIRMNVRDEFVYDSYFLVEKEFSHFFGIGNDDTDLVLDTPPFLFSLETGFLVSLLRYFHINYPSKQDYFIPDFE